ncbi:glutathione S-transferase family protein [Aspergillus ibericus CBS 121593]|uniref:glutathione transferase n=1 Tax=Aspergillus ibericus CBS 121593 TaxID=1448316 RepID=A0A395H3G6_9EURO|nr:glutathione S-transferase Ure2-like protein [Aspergillus ibericus CBS 121593]RAL00764.1 glutathione S-transferase Ure2-like protein [Aspergillus ibericus CBS 121593]
MSTSLQPIKVYGGFGPNPMKISIILAELNLPIEPIPIEFNEVKQPAYEAINPNGRLPAIEDPNTGLTLWESGAIIEYLIETYDTTHKLSFPAGSHEAHQARQWLHYQMSGQGPYYGQAVWFARYHPERVPSAVERYVNEIKRVSKVLDTWLATREWLVGEKMSYVDLAFVPWQNGARKMLVEEGFDQSQYPHLTRWLERMNERPTVRELTAKQDAIMAEKSKSMAAAQKK